MSRSSTRATPRRIGRIQILVFAIWFVGISVPMATLAVQHDIPFLVSAIPAAAGEALPRPADHATIRHVLAADCECSETVAEGLIARRADPREREHIWIVGHAPELGERLQAAGYRVREISTDDARDALGIVGVPFLVVYDPGTTAVRYAGGYSPRRPQSASELRTDAIVRSVRAGHAERPYPAYGCIVGEQLRQQVDPLGFKYGRASTPAKS